MTAPSNANTSGLEVVAWRFRSRDGFGGWSFERSDPSYLDPSGYVIQPLVTAASAQARIAELEARVAELEAAKWEVKHVDTMNDMVAMGLARDAAEARADRLASGISSAKLILTPEPGEAPLTEREKEARQLLAALQQETQP